MAVDLDHEGSVSVVTIDRPQAMNAFDQGTALALKGTIEQAVEDDETGAIVLQGTGKRAFCTGADLDAFADALDEGDAVQVVSRLSGTINDVILTLVNGPKPVVACVNGVAAGGGLGLALACDLRIAGESARLTPAFLGVGVSPDGGTTWFLPRMVGLARTREILLRNEVLDAASALEEGLLTEVVADNRVRERAHEVARELAEGPREAIESTKEHLATEGPTLRERLEAEQEATALSAEHPDFREGIEAFLEGREPSFG